LIIDHIHIISRIHVLSFYLWTSLIPISQLTQSVSWLRLSRSA